MDKLKLLQKNIQKLENAVVAFSGSIDSILLLTIAKQTLGNNVIAITLTSELMPKEELKKAKKLTKSLNVKHLFIPSENLKDKNITANTPLRCYHCRKLHFSLLKKLAKEKGFHYVIEGSNLDDLNNYSPGNQAAKELGIISPLQEVKLNNYEICQYGRSLSLPGWNNPVKPCLATRIPYGTPITKKILVQIEKAEKYLTELLKELQKQYPDQIKENIKIRISHHGDLARLEIAPEAFSLITSPNIAKTIHNKLRKINYNYVTLDFWGNRQKNMNELLNFRKIHL
ncbi:MAG: ATP-dependent sacrificial sulfur transferase LarE [Peptococcia bacterium]|jgi:uncharacterized protein